MINASVYIITQDEEKNISRVLKSVKDFAEIIIVDSGSKDKTIDIAKNFNLRVKVYNHKWKNYSDQKAYALLKCTKKWVLNLDADEELSQNAKQEIIDLIEDESADAVSFSIYESFIGKFPNKFTHFNSKVRFFKKEKGNYDLKNLAHEGVIINGNIKKAKGFIYHYGITSIENIVNKFNKYSTLKAKEKADKGKQYCTLKLLFVFPFTFLKSYLLRRNFLNGIRGVIVSVNVAYYAFIKEAKLYEKIKTEKNKK